MARVPLNQRPLFLQVTLDSRFTAPVLRDRAHKEWSAWPGVRQVQMLYPEDPLLAHLVLITVDYGADDLVAERLRERAEVRQVERIEKPELRQ